MNQEKKKLIQSLTFAFVWVAILWVIKGIELVLGSDFGNFGLLPRHVRGLLGIFTAPFIHGSVRDHLLSNSLSLFPLAATLFYFYRPIAFRVIFAIVVITGIWVWIAARTSMHIGVSGVIYGLAAFLFFSGIFRKDLVAMALALIVVMFHGSMVWGTMPFFTPENVSWESHLFGGISGILTAFFWRKEGRPPRKKYSWEDEPQEERESGFEYWNYKKNFPPPEGYSHPE